MKTKIYKTYDKFLKRKDKTTNGVSPDFAKQHPKHETDNETNKGCWNCSNCYDCTECIDSSDLIRCVRCNDCYDCIECIDSSYCNGKDKSDKCNYNELIGVSIPIIKNIHQKIYKAVKQPGALNMDDWHTCSTTHCRAGWVIVLGGEEAQELEEQTSTSFAALAIYNKSSPIKVLSRDFYKSNKKALKDMKRCAELEKQQA